MFSAFRSNIDTGSSPTRSVGQTIGFRRLAISAIRTSDHKQRWSAPLACIIFLLATSAHAQLPDGPGKAETEKLCKQCHELERAISLRQDRTGWQITVDKMLSLGMRATDKEIAAVIDYLSTNFAGEQLPKLNVNKASAIDFETRLTLRRSEAAAIIAYRDKNGPFKSIEDLEKVPGIDPAKIEAKRDRLAF